MGFPWGLDLGNQNCVIAIARKGGIDVIDNEASSRKVRLFDLACTRVHAREWGLPPPGPYPEHDARMRTGEWVLAFAESSDWAQGGLIWPSFGVRCRGLLHVLRWFKRFWCGTHGTCALEECRLCSSAIASLKGGQLHALSVGRQ